MSRGTESKESVKRRNAMPDRMKLRGAQGNLFQKNNPGKVKVYKTRYHQKSPYAQMIDESRNPLLITSDNIAYTSDWHIPFTDEPLIQLLFAEAEKNGTKDLVIAGDFWDCDDYSRFTHMAPPACFESEIENVSKELRRILRVFDRVFICRGNHEKRWIDLNAGKMGMRELFRLAIPGNISEDDFFSRVSITTDDHINLIQKGHLWLLCHPKNFRQINLSVARDLASKHLCSVIVGHGHQWAQGQDRSGRFHLLDGGGMFLRDALDYQRDTSCHPMTQSGFYILKDGEILPFKGGL